MRHYFRIPTWTLLSFLVLTGVHLSSQTPGKEVLFPEGSMGKVFALQYSPDGKYLFIGDNTGKVSVMNLQDHSTYLLEQESDQVASIQHHPTLPQIAYGTKEGIVFTDPYQKKTLEKMKNPGGQFTTYCLRYSPDGSRIFAGTYIGTINVIDAQKFEVIEKLKFHTRAVSYLDLSPDGRLLAACGSDGYVSVWDVGQLAQVKTLYPSTQAVFNVLFSPDQKKLVTCGIDGKIKIFDYESGAMELELLSYPTWVNCIRFSHDGKYLVCGCKDGMILLYDWQERKQIASFKAHKDNIENNIFSPDDQYIVSASDNGDVIKWDISGILTSSHKTDQLSRIIEQNITENLKKSNPDVVNKYMQNNRILNSFQTDSEGLCYVTIDNVIYHLCSGYGDKWCRVTGKVLYLSVNPDNPNIFYSINTENKVYKSTNKGKDWIQIQNGLNQIDKFSKVIINPYNNSEVFLLGEFGIYKTNDAGFTWTDFQPCTLPKQLLFNTTKRDILYLLLEEGLFISENAGSSWENIGEKIPKLEIRKPGKPTVYKPTDVQAILHVNYLLNPCLVAFTNNGIYKTSDEGKTWSLMDGVNNKSTKILAAYITDNEVYIGGADHSGSVLFSSDNNLLSWKEIKITDPDFDTISGIFINPDYKGIFVSSKMNKIAYIDPQLNIIGLNYGLTRHSNVQLYFSIDSTNTKETQFAIIANEDNIDVQNFGLWRSENSGLTWKRCNINLSCPHSNDNSRFKFFRSPTNNKELFILSKYDNCMFISYDKGLTWSDISEDNNGGYNSITCFQYDPLDSNIIYIARGYVHYYLERFDKWTKGNTQLRESGLNFLIDSENSKNICTRSMEISHDGGWTWNPLIDNIVNSVGADFYSNGFSPVLFQGNKILYISQFREYGTLIQSEDLGRTWTKTWSVNGRIYDVTINSDNPSKMIALVQTFNENGYWQYTSCNVYLTTDGENWKQVLKYAINEDNRRFFFDADVVYYYFDAVFSTVDSGIYVYGIEGLLRSIDNGNSWRKIGGIRKE